MKTIADRDSFWKRARESLEDMLDKLEGLDDFDCAPIPAKEICVLSVDMNKGFAKEGNLYSPRVEEMLPDTAAFLAACKKAKVAVAAFSDRHTEDSPELTYYPEHCTGPEEYELAPELQPLQLPVCYKNSTNALFAGMSRILKMGFRTYIITGCCTDICIYQFAVALKAFFNEKNLEAEVVVPLKYVDTYDSQWHHADLLNLVFLDSMASNGVLLCADVLVDRAGEEATEKPEETGTADKNR